MNEPLELTILLPTLDEGAHLARVLRDVRAAAGGLTGDFEILVVDGGSDDGTVAAAEAAGARVLRQNSQGFGAAIREGLAAARGRWVLALDADGSHPVRFFRELWSHRQGRDLVIASRFAAGGGANMSWWRYALSWWLNTVARAWLALPVKDSSSGFRLYRREAVAGLPLTTKDLRIQQETLVHLLARGARVEEIPFHYEARLGGKSKTINQHLAWRFLCMLWTLKKMRGGREPWLALAAVLALGCGTGLWGLGWGLPGPARLRSFPGAERPSPEAADQLAHGWGRLYADIERAHQDMREEPANLFSGAEEFAPGWSFPPDKLANSARSMLLQTEHPDEKKPFTNLSRMRPWRLQLKPLYAHYGGTFLYPLGAFLAAGSLAGVVRLVPDVAHYLRNPEDMGRLFLWARLFNFFFHLAGLVLLFLLGCRLGGWGVGLAAAALFSLCPLAIDNAHQLKPYPYATFWILAACWGALAAAARGRRGDYLLAGLGAGIAIGANFSLAVFALLPALAWGLSRRQKTNSDGEWRWALAALAAAAGIFVLSNPYLLFSYKDFAWELKSNAPEHLGVSPAQVAALLPGSAAANLGGVTAGLGALGLVLGLLAGKPDGSRRMLAGLALAGALMIAVRFPIAVSLGGFRLFHASAALACLLGADLLWRWPRPLRVLCLAAVLVDSGLRSFVLLDNMRRDSTSAATRTQAADWIETNVPPGSRVGLTRYPEPAHTPAFCYNRYRLLIFDSPQALTGRTAPEYLVVDAMGQRSLEPWLGRTYEIAARFQPFSIGWARQFDEISFANEAFTVYRLRGRPG